MRILTWAVCASAAAATQLHISPIESSLDVTTVSYFHRNTSLLSSYNASNEECCTSSVHLQEILTLSELPLKRLLRVRLAMQPVERMGEPADEVTDEPAEKIPQAEALRGRERPRPRPPVVPRGDIIDAGHDSAPKQSKLATGFQLAITVLSFLAFGAYLISLVVSIVRNQSGSGTAVTTQQPFVLVPATAGKRRKRRLRSNLPEWLPPNLPAPDHIFDAITAAAQAYARFEGHDIEL